MCYGVSFTFKTFEIERVQLISFQTERGPHSSPTFVLKDHGPSLNGPIEICEPKDSVWDSHDDVF